MENKKIVLAYFGHHKCGSKMIMSIMGRASRYMGLKQDNFHSPKMWGYDENHKTLDMIVADKELDFVTYNNADKKFLGDDSQYLGLHVIRDPRDIVISSYFSHRNSHSTDQWPELVEFRKVLEKLPQNEGILESLKFTANLKIDGWNINLFDALMNWDYSLPNILEVKFEKIVNNPYQAFLDIFEFMGILEDKEIININSIIRYRLSNIFPNTPFMKKNYRIPVWLLLFFVYTNRFSKLAGGRDIGQEDVKSHYRKGTPGDWKNYFSDQHKLIFKKNYNDLLIKLGYEVDENW